MVGRLASTSSAYQPLRSSISLQDEHDEDDDDKDDDDEDEDDATSESRAAVTVP